MVLKILSSVSIVCVTLFTACTSTEEVETLVADKSEEQKSFSEDDAKVLFSLKCASCHGADGKLGLAGAKDLSTSALTDSQIFEIIRDGKNGMPAFGETIPEEQLNALVSIVKSLRK